MNIVLLWEFSNVTFPKQQVDGLTELRQFQGERFRTISVTDYLHFTYSSASSIYEWNTIGVYGGDTVSSPVVSSFHPCEPLKEPWRLKSLKAEVSERGEKQDKTQRRLCVLAIGSAKKSSREREGGGSRGSFLEGKGEMWITASERKQSAKVPHCGNPTDLSLAPLHSGHKEGISSFIYSISCHVPLFGQSPPFSPQKRPLMNALFFKLLFSLGWEGVESLALVNWEPCIEKSWICGSVTQFELFQ